MRLFKAFTGSSGLRLACFIPAVGSLISQEREPPLWEDCDTQTDDGVQIEPDWATEWDAAAQPALDYKVDQRVN